MSIEVNRITGAIVDAAFKVHSRLGPGLLESVYEAILAHELRARGFAVVRQQPIPVVYDSLRMGVGFRADLVVENCVIVEVKSIDSVAMVHKMQLRTYLRLTGIRVGLLINFNTVLIKDGIHRVANAL